MQRKNLKNILFFFKETKCYLESVDKIRKIILEIKFDFSLLSRKL